ncbi:MAG TPA: 2-amino-4-hydroxy-6-hydroxymethyldihydropteridine diphosphokinase, partial [Xanthomonadales bacterium]|nr:2-amino-4-hydroxy-6-hydroxymethyldihydropteridine diphosphokinase [Xanthomonadales bacterium]
MAIAYLGLGSNVDAERHIRIAVQALEEQFGQVELSPVYRSEAVGFEGDDFLNLAARITTNMTPLQLRAFLRALEARHGRDRNTPKWSDRTLDIDILLYDELVVYGEDLEIPRREILKFAHVLKPLADLA